MSTEALCYLINQDIDWSTKDLTHLDLKLTVKATDRQLLLRAINSPYWPEAVPQASITATDGRRQRATTILTELVKHPLAGKRFLDFGCGTGECVDVATNAGALAYGYDLKASDAWNGLAGKYTTNLQSIKDAGPYDVILCYDVLDHIVPMTEDALKPLSDLATDDTILYFRCHPFSSRHGSHHYLSYNKAYAHLFLTEYELPPAEKVTKTIHPNRIYPALFNRHGFTIKSQAQVIVHPEPIINAMVDYVMPWWQRYKITEPYLVLKMMSIQFCDFVLGKKI